jgi:hypothetical protein
MQNFPLQPDRIRIQTVNTSIIIRLACIGRNAVSVIPTGGGRHGRAGEERPSRPRQGSAASHPASGLLSLTLFRCSAPSKAAKGAAQRGPGGQKKMATTKTAAVTMTVKITPNDKGNPPGKLADAELHFTGGPLAGLKLIGFAIWERRGGSGRNVTFPARQYSVNGERRSFALLRPVADVTAQESVRDAILAAYAESETAVAATA